MALHAAHLSRLGAIAMERFTSSQTWYVCFMPSTTRTWYNFFLHPQFRHILLLRETDGGVLVANSMAHCFAIDTYPGEIKDYITGIVLSRTVHYGMIYEPMPILPTSCVTFACRLLGIRKRIFTPRGLYKELIKCGANIIIPHNPCGNKLEML